MMELGAPIGSGHVAEVFEAGPDVLKLYRAGFGRDVVEHEIAVMTVVGWLPLPVPAVRGLREVHGRWGVLMSRAPGRSLMEALGAEGMPAVLARLHRVVHACPGVLLGSYKDRLAANLRDAPLLSETDRERLLAQLAALPDGDRLCHGDFHPGNIMGTIEAPVIIDWLDATQGPPEADACRTYLLALHHMPTLAEPYLDAYLAAAGGLPRKRIADWLPVIAAARLTENVGAEEERLLQLSRG